MDEDPNNQSAFLVKIPMEVISYTLSFLPDKKSLLNTILTCRVLNNAYNHRKTYIASSVLFGPMHESVYQEAVVFYHLVHEQWHGGRAGVRAIHRVFANERPLDEQQLPLYQRMTLEDIKAMHLFHENVEWWVKRITTNLKRNHPVLRDNHSPFHLTPAILNRFKRAVYRLYMYINVLEKAIASSCADNGGRNRLTTPAERDEAHWCSLLNHLEEHRILRAFYSHFSTAEVEQMVVICELLVTEITPSINLFIQYDIELGALMRTFVDQPRIGMPMVVQGLKFMRDFVNARSYYERFTLMRMVNPDDWLPSRSARAYFPLHDEQLLYDLHHSGLSSEDLKELATEPDPLWLSREPFYNDGDIGPQWAWRKFNHRAAQFGGAEYHTEFVARPWGYVFWDRYMLEARGLMMISDDGASDHMPIVPRPHNLYRVWYPYRRWRTHQACRWVFLAYYVKAALRAWWGRMGWFNVHIFPPRHLMGQLFSINRDRLTEDEIQLMMQMMLFSYSYEYGLTHPYIYLVAPGEAGLF